MIPLTIIGAGGYGHVIAELALECGYEVAQFLDDDPSKFGKTIADASIQGPIQSKLEALPNRAAVAVAIGNNLARLEWLRAARAFGLTTPRLISPNAHVSPSAEIHDGVFLHPGSHVWTKASLEVGSIVSPLGMVSHHAALDKGCFISARAIVGTSVQVGRCALIGIGSTVSTTVRRIGRHGIIGAGAVILSDTQANGVYVGNPGRLTLRDSLVQHSSLDLNNSLSEAFEACRIEF